MINANESKEVLINMLSESKFDFNNPNSKLALEIFKKFFSIKVDCADDGLLFQCGVEEVKGEALFYSEFVRQFTFELDDGEYNGMEQLRLTIYFKPNAKLQGLDTNLWEYDCNSVEEFFNKVENMDNFKIPFEKYVPLKCEVEQSGV
ncbi:hypothetical protein KPL35_13610 [Clostridium sp. CF011]|uniref:hypothetical protein n=1 Tax=Clostridium sp. CF011 TaxID=2843318 RepID=UPI001C0ACA99|nr:hypothetical protein [Clostridium sp. CF011]MBU3093106.1 hypothetical protein [Clostridium sp. CF011]WAG71121.1 hypothetical protein LL036_06790 [Clostridium sp. CF011]